MEVELYQSNHEGDLVDKIQWAMGRRTASSINPAAYTHTSVAILDALKAVALPAVEVHLSDVNARGAVPAHFLRRKWLARSPSSAWALRATARRSNISNRTMDDPDPLTAPTFPRCLPNVYHVYQRKPLGLKGFRVFLSFVVLTVCLPDVYHANFSGRKPRFSPSFYALFAIYFPMQGAICRPNRKKLVILTHFLLEAGNCLP